MATGDAAYIAGKLKGDNRTAVGSKVKGADTVLLATSVGPDGSALTNVSKAALTAETATSAAFKAAIPADDVAARTLVVPILPNKVTTGAPGYGEYDRRNVRTQYFILPGTYDSTKAGFGAKRCYVNLQGWPLKADGTKAESVADAADAETTKLSAVGEAVSNGEQVYRTADSDRAPWPGKYESHPSQTSLYAPYAGWTVQDDIPAP